MEWSTLLDSYPCPEFAEGADPFAYQAKTDAYEGIASQRVGQLRVSMRRNTQIYQLMLSSKNGTAANRDDIAISR